MSLFKSNPTTSAVLRKRLDDAQARLPAAEEAVQRAALEAETSGDETAYSRPSRCTRT
jgi:hypothetical protein